jgi:hypothetical protein
VGTTIVPVVSVDVKPFVGTLPGQAGGTVSPEPQADTLLRRKRISGPNVTPSGPESNSPDDDDNDDGLPPPPPPPPLPPLRHWAASASGWLLCMAKPRPAAAAGQTEVGPAQHRAEEPTVIVSSSLFLPGKNQCCRLAPFEPFHPPSLYIKVGKSRPGAKRRDE